MYRGYQKVIYFSLIFVLELSVEISPRLTFKMHVFGSSSSSEASEVFGGEPNGFDNMSEISQGSNRHNTVFFQRQNSQLILDVLMQNI